MWQKEFTNERVRMRKGNILARSRRTCGEGSRCRGLGYGIRPVTARSGAPVALWTVPSEALPDARIDSGMAPPLAEEPAAHYDETFSGRGPGGK